MEGESELVKVTGTAALCALPGPGVRGGGGWRGGRGGGLVRGGERSPSRSVLHLCLPGEHPAAAALPARGSELPALAVYGASAALRAVTAFLHAA